MNYFKGETIVVGKKVKLNTATLKIIAVMLSVILGLISIVLFYYDNDNRISNLNNVENKENSVRICRDMDAFLKTRLEIIGHISKYYSSFLTSKDEIRDDLFPILAKDSCFDYIEYVDDDGWNHNVTGGFSYAKDRQYYINGMVGNSGIETVYNSRATHQTMLMIYTPVYFEDSVIGVLIGAITTEGRVSELLDVSFYESGAEIYLCDTNGYVFAKSNDNLRMNVKNKYSIFSVFNGTEFESLVKNVVTSENNGVCETKIDNGDICCAVKTEQYGWSVVSVFPRQAHNYVSTNSTSLTYKLIIKAVVIFVVMAIIIVIITHMEQGVRQKRENEYNEKLNQAVISANEANKAKTVFLNNMSHDIRTPMNAICGYTTMAKKYSNDPEKTNNYLGKIELASNSLLELINQVLEMSRIDSGKIELSEVKIDLKQKLDEQITIYSSIANTRNISLSLDYSKIYNPYVCIDSTRFTQIITNIIGNAIKYTQNGGSIRVFASQESSNVSNEAFYKFEIADNGVGMDQKYLEHIFEEFSRENDTTQNGVQGTGLGMSIVKRLVELFKGTIHIDSKKGVGTTVTIVLPMKIIDSTDKENLNLNDTVVLSGKKVLLVDDNIMNREIATEILEESGMIVKTAEDGQNAVDLIRNSKPGDYDLVLMDVHMPRMNGYEATKIIRSLPNYQDVHLPIIALSANAFEEDKKQSLEAGMDAHVAKPIDIKLLQKTILNVIGLKNE